MGFCRVPKAIEATGAKKIIMAALWTEVCLVYSALDMLLEGYEIYALSDVSGGTTLDTHERGMERLVDIMTEHLLKSIPSS